MLRKTANLLTNLALVVCILASCLGWSLNPSSQATKGALAVSLAQQTRAVDMPSLLLVATMAAVRAEWWPLEAQHKGDRLKWVLVAIAFAEISRAKSARNFPPSDIDQLMYEIGGYAIVGAPLALAVGLHFSYALSCAAVAGATLLRSGRWEFLGPLGILVFVCVAAPTEHKQLVFDIAYPTTALVVALTNRGD